MPEMTADEVLMETPEPATSIKLYAAKMVSAACREGKVVRGTFNGVPLTATPRTERRAVENAYWQELRRREEAREQRRELAFAVLEEVEATIGHGCAQHWAAQVLETVRARLEAKRDDTRDDH